MSPECIRYVGRTNDLDTRLRMHIGNAAWEHKVKDLWIMYLQYMGRNPVMVIIEQASFDDKKASEEWAKDRERYWISHHDQHDADLFNEPQWSRHSSRNRYREELKRRGAKHMLVFGILIGTGRRSFDYSNILIRLMAGSRKWNRNQTFQFSVNLWQRFRLQNFNINGDDS